MKLCVLLLATLFFYGCNKVNPDFIVLENTLINGSAEILELASDNTAFVRIPTTDELTKIYTNNKKTAVFWSNISNDAIKKYIHTDSCLLNAKLDYTGKCPYRIYCGTQTALFIATATNTMYAVEICK